MLCNFYDVLLFNFIFSSKPLLILIFSKKKKKELSGKIPLKCLNNDQSFCQANLALINTGDEQTLLLSAWGRGKRLIAHLQ